MREHHTMRGSVVFTHEGLERAEKLFKEMFEE